MEVGFCDDVYGSSLYTKFKITLREQINLNISNNEVLKCLLESIWACYRLHLELTLGSSETTLNAAGSKDLSLGN